MTTTAPVTPHIRFAAVTFARTYAPRDRFMANRPSYVEAFPHSYTPELVARAQALLTRMAEPIYDVPVLDALNADLRQFNADVEAEVAAR